MHSKDDRGMGLRDQFLPHESSKDHLNVEQFPQNNFWTLSEHTRHPKRQPDLFETR